MEAAITVNRCEQIMACSVLFYFILGVNILQSISYLLHFFFISGTLKHQNTEPRRKKIWWFTGISKFLIRLQITETAKVENKQNMNIYGLSLGVASLVTKKCYTKSAKKFSKAKNKSEDVNFVNRGRLKIYL